MKYMKRTCIGGISFALMSAAAALAGDSSAADYERGTAVTPLLSTRTTSIGQPIEYPLTSNPEVTALEVEIAPGKQTGWHTHPYPTYGYILSGAVTIEIRGGKRIHYEAGEAFAEAVGVPHNGITRGKAPTKILVFFTGEAGKPYMVLDERQAGAD